MDPAERFPKLAHHLKEETNLAEEVDRCFSYIESLEQELQDTAQTAARLASDAVSDDRRWQDRRDELAELPELPPVEHFSPVTVHIDLAAVLQKYTWTQALALIEQTRDVLKFKPEVDSEP